ncbi:MAG: 4Fe-4S binding protein [Actinomycetia bacterium]|nr:4Fe-4S binding protein [Actinomycetes bacterium]
MPRLTRRRWVQILSTVVLNPIVPNYFTGTIVQAQSKGICVPVLNCYSCPAAIGACPIGSLQHAVASIRFRLSTGEFQAGLYVLGSLGVVGSLVGRFPCGWLCPFGLLQEVLHKIPGPKLRLPRILKYLKYIILALTVFILPALVLNAAGFGDTWFCKWICPAGTLEAGLPLVAADADIRSMVGLLFVWKVALLVAFVLWMIVSLRPFCRTICPLGAILGLFNKISLLRLTVDHRRCLSCGSCSRACPVDLDVPTQPNSPECIRCLKCIKACDAGCIGYRFSPHGPAAEADRPVEQEAAAAGSPPDGPRRRPG